MPAMSGNASSMSGAASSVSSYSALILGDGSGSSTPPSGSGGGDNLPGLVSDATLETAQIVVNVGILPVLVLCGFTGNVINMAVFLRQGLSDRINLCLFSLALSDTGFSLFHFSSRSISRMLSLVNPPLGEYWLPRSLMFIGVYLGFFNVSNCMTLIISLERCICVTFPLHAKRLLSARQMAIIIIAVYTFCLFGTGFGSFKYYPQAYIDPVTNATRYRIALTDFYVNNRRFVNTVFEIICNATIQTVSLVVVVSATTIIAVRMRSVLAWRRETAQPGGGAQSASSAENQRETAVTRMLLVVCMVYCTCTTPSAVQALTRNFVADYIGGGRYSNLFYLTLTFTYFLSTVNCSVNFIIYYTMSTRYRETLHEMLGLGKKGAGDVNKKAGGKTSATTLSSLSSA